MSIPLIRLGDFLPHFVIATMGALGCGNTYVVPNGESPPEEAGTPRVLDLTEDITLPDGTNWQMIGEPGARCLIRGNGHRIVSAVRWNGRFVIRSCDIVGLGTADTPAIQLAMQGTASAIIEDSTFDASGQVRVLNYDASTTVFSRNTILANSLVPAVAIVRDSTPAFFAQVEEGTGKKFFQGNLILKSFADISGGNWTIGGDSAADGNRFIGLRAGLFLNAPGLVVRGNYIHTIYPTSPELVHGQEVAPFTLLGNRRDLLVEHNVIRHGHWVMRSISGELRYNAIVDADESDWIREPQSGSSIHHNVFVNYAVPGEETNAIPINPSVQGGIELIDNMSEGIQIWANTFDGGGPSKFFHGTTISIASGSALQSARSNLFMRFPYRDGSSAIGFGPDEQPGTPARLEYADYNLFYNPNAAAIDNYGIAVGTKAERQDPGFGANDIPRLGAKDAQVNPMITGPFVARFPWSDDQIQSGAITVSDMLAYFRAVYTPSAGSPLIDNGDPQDGAGSDIGAIGAGAANPSDRFGDFPAGAPVTSLDGGNAASPRRESDGPLALRCSTGALANSRDRSGPIWMWLVMALLSRLLITPSMAPSTFSAGSGRRRSRRANLARWSSRT